MPAVTPTPGFALLTGTNFVKRTTADAYYAINGFAKLSVVACIDPRLIWNAGQSGVIASKHRTDNNQRQWRMSYNAADGKITVELWDTVAAVSPLASRVTAAGVFIRSTIAFVYDGLGVIDLYINGSLSNGALTGTVPTSLPNNTEPLSIGAENPSGTPANVWRGAIYAFGLWNYVLSGAQIATVVRDGLFPAALKSIGLAPQIICEHTTLTQGSNKRLTVWTDTSANAYSLTPTAVTGLLPFAQKSSGGLIVLSNLWNDPLLDTGDVVLGEGLTSTYTSSAPFRLWGIGLSAPARLNHRSEKHDFTILLRARRVSGTTDTLFVQIFGVELRYTLASKEMFANVGADSTVALLNTKISYGVNIFPVEGLTADIVLRYNAESQDLDLFIGQTQYTKTPSATSAFYNGSTTTFADRADFATGIVVPMALSDTQVSALLAQVSQNVFSPLLGISPTVLGTTDDPALNYTLKEFESGVIYAPIVSTDTILVQLSGNLASPVLSKLLTKPGFINDTYTPAEIPPNELQDPLPVANFVTVNDDFVVTASGTAGVTDTLTLHWWEIETGPPASPVVAITPQILTSLFFTARQTDVRSFRIPYGDNWNGKRIRMVVQAVENAGVLWYSGWLNMEGEGYNTGAGPQSVALPKTIVLEKALAPTIGKPGPGIFRIRTRDFS